MKNGPGILEYAIILILVVAGVIVGAKILPAFCVSLCCLSPILIPVWFGYQKQITKFFTDLSAQIKTWVDDLK